MARETWPAILTITSPSAPDSASSVTKVWRLSCHRPTTFALSRTFVHAVFNGQPILKRRSFCTTFTLHPRMAA
jgi:hypothetical protein